MSKTTYSVTDISKEFDVCEETVRRWIRSGKLKATLIAKKDGYFVTEKNLNDFISDFPYKVYKSSIKPKNALIKKLKREIDELKKKVDELEKQINDLSKGDI